MSAVFYEWCVETVTADDVEDIEDLDHWGTYAEAKAIMDVPARPGTTQAEALAWAREWHAQRPTHREVIAGYGYAAEAAA